MDKRLQQVLLWAPRVMGIFGVFFLGLFALDVFEMDASIGEMIGALLIHLLPSALLLLAVALGWRLPAVGGVVFLALGALYIILTWGAPWSWWVLISGPLFLIGILFLAGWRMSSQAAYRS